MDCENKLCIYEIYIVIFVEFFLKRFELKCCFFYLEFFLLFESSVNFSKLYVLVKV